MPRTLAAGTETGTQADWVRPLILVEMLFGSGPVRMWTGYGDFQWSNRTWTGTGTLLGISPVEETTEVRAAGVRLTLSGVPSDVLALALAEPYQNRPCSIFVGVLNVNTGALLADPYEVFRGRMDTMQIEENGEDATVTVAAESRLLDLERPRERRYQHEDQRIIDNNDKFFEFVPTIQDIEIKWGRG